MLNPLFKNGTFKKGSGRRPVDRLGHPNKGLTIFEQMLTRRQSNQVDAAIAANDGLAGSVISALKNHGASTRSRSPARTRRPTGVQYIVSGWQTGTVYKSIKVEAAAAAKAAIALVKGGGRRSPQDERQGQRDLPSILLKPIWVTKSNYTILNKDGFVKKNQVCVGEFAKFCKSRDAPLGTDWPAAARRAPDAPRRARPMWCGNAFVALERSDARASRGLQVVRLRPGAGPRSTSRCGTAR